MSLKVYSICALLLAAGCATRPAPAGSDVRAGFDTSVRACDDFYQHSVGTWLKENPVPPAFDSWGSFNVLAEDNRAKLRRILEEAAMQDAPAGSSAQRLGDFWTTCINEKAIEQQGLEPLAEELARIERIRTISDVVDSAARLRSMGLPALFAFNTDSDLKNPSVNIAILGQAGLGLPEPNYYSDSDDGAKRIREAYLAYVTRLLALTGDDAASAERYARELVTLETKLASASLTRVQRRDIESQYNIRTLADLQESTPRFDWRRWLAAIDAPPFERLNVAHPKYFAELHRQLAETPVAVWSNYLRYRLADAAAPFLSSDFSEASFEFRGRVLQGRKEQFPRERRCVAWADQFLSDDLGRTYAARHFTPETRRRALEMIENLRGALRTGVRDLPWMTDATKQHAMEKLDAIALKIGYPEKWRDYSSIHIGRTSLAANILQGTRYLARTSIEKIGKPIDRTEWEMSASTVNAYNNPVWNEIVFSAGILQPPFYDPNADDAYNYGGMGAVIGHELIHDFDDQGRKFAADGSLTDWWTPEDAARFDEAAACIAEQFSGFDLGGGLHMDGKLVLGESMADLGGLGIAYAAYMKSIEGQPRRVVDGLTPEQRFFVGWSRIWAENETRETMEVKVKTDPHPVSRYRVNGPLSNLPEFAAAYGCDANDPMVRAKRCEVW